MKKQILIILILIFSFVSGMKGQGDWFCQYDFLSSTCYKIEKGNRFEYRNSMCVGIEEGKGRYEIKANVIIFTYEPIEFFEKQFAIKKIKEDKDNVKIKLTVKDYDSQEIIKTYINSREKRTTRK